MIGHVTPEAYDGGPIALIQEGDTLTIDKRNRTINIVSYTNFNNQFGIHPLECCAGCFE